MVIAGGVRVPQPTLTAHEIELRAQGVQNIRWKSGRLPPNMTIEAHKWRPWSAAEYTNIKPTL